MAVSEEKRHFSRIAIDGPLLLVCNEASWETTLVDISLKGALLMRPQDWGGERGTGCRIEITDEQRQPLITMQGEVAHVHPDQIGFRCHSMDLDSISHLKRLLQLNLGDEALLQRELTELIAVREASERL